MPIVPCAPSPITKGIVTFDPSIFVDANHYPEFATVPAGQLNFNFLRAQLLLNNTCGSRVCDANARETMLDLLVAHLTFLTNGANGQPPPGIVGRISTATEGSVSVTAEYSTEVSQSQAFYIQSKYGALYWEMTAQYRTGVYIPPPAGGCLGPFSGTGLGPMGTGFCGYNGGSS